MTRSGAEGIERRQDHASCHRLAELRAAVAGAQRRVEDVARPRLLHRAGAGIERHLVGRAIEQIGIGPEDVLRAVAVVHVEVDHRHALGTMGGACVVGGDRGLVEEAEAHGAAAFRHGGRAGAGRRRHCRPRPRTRHRRRPSLPRPPRSAASSVPGDMAVSASRNSKPSAGAIAARAAGAHRQWARRMSSSRPAAPRAASGRENDLNSRIWFTAGCGRRVPDGPRASHGGATTSCVNSRVVMAAVLAASAADCYRAAMPSPADIEDAARALREGRLVAFPTETVYGLGADATNDRRWPRSMPRRGGPPSIR